MESEVLEASPQATELALALPKATVVLGGLVSPTVNNGYFCRELEGLQKVGFKGFVNHGSVLKPLSFQSAE